jgi:hypothetical protein
MPQPNINTYLLCQIIIAQVPTKYTTLINPSGKDSSHQTHKLSDSSIFQTHEKEVWLRFLFFTYGKIKYLFVCVPKKQYPKYQNVKPLKTSNW